MKYKPGQSGNPGGITREEMQARVAYRKWLAKQQPKALKSVERNMDEDAKWMLEQLHGKAKQQTEITGEGGGPIKTENTIDFGKATNDELVRYLREKTSGKG